MDVVEVIGAVIGACTLLGFVIKGTNSLARIEVTMASQVEENKENKLFRVSTERTMNNHENRISNLETDVRDMNDRDRG